MKSLVFQLQKSRVTNVCERCGNDLPRDVLVVRQGARSFHPECFEKHLAEQMTRYKQALARLRREI
jgi:hypothetical protein